jgi:hypothetical protein
MPFPLVFGPASIIGTCNHPSINAIGGYANHTCNFLWLDDKGKVWQVTIYKLKTKKQDQG